MWEDHRIQDSSPWLGEHLGTSPRQRFDPDSFDLLGHFGSPLFSVYCHLEWILGPFVMDSSAISLWQQMDIQVSAWWITVCWCFSSLFFFFLARVLFVCLVLLWWLLCVAATDGRQSSVKLVSGVSWEMGKNDTEQELMKWFPFSISFSSVVIWRALRFDRNEGAVQIMYLCTSLTSLLFPTQHVSWCGLFCSLFLTTECFF